MWMLVRNSKLSKGWTHEAICLIDMVLLCYLLGSKLKRVVHRYLIIKKLQWILLCSRVETPLEISISSDFPNFKFCIMRWSSKETKSRNSFFRTKELWKCRRTVCQVSQKEDLWLTPFIMCSAHRGMFSTLGGGVLCTSGGYHEYIGEYHEYIGGIPWFIWRSKVDKNLSFIENPDVLNIPQCTHDIPPHASWYSPDVLNTHYTRWLNGVYLTENHLFSSSELLSAQS